MSRQVHSSIFVVVVLCALASPILVRGQVEVRHTSTYAGAGRYKWTAYIKTDPATLKRIDYVEYRLHPTFPKPLRKVIAPRTGLYPFSTSDMALDNFKLGVTVYFRDEKRYLVLPEYYLILKPVKYGKSTAALSKATIYRLTQRRPPDHAAHSTVSADVRTGVGAVEQKIDKSLDGAVPRR